MTRMKTTTDHQPLDTHAKRPKPSKVYTRLRGSAVGLLSAVVDGVVILVRVVVAVAVATTASLR